jgi:hypothetical protein
MSFEYSCGDFIAGANLSYRLIKALSTTQEPCIEYQEAISEIASLQQTFLLVSNMQPNRNLDAATINAAGFIVMSSMNLIADFLAKTEEYRRKMSTKHCLSNWQKMGWVLFRKDELVELKDTLHQKLSNINVLLSTANL